MIHILKKYFHAARRAVARRWLSSMHVTQIAITGSQGKTAVSQGLYALLRTLRPTVVTDVNLDTIYNVPITALHVRPYHHYAIFELGIDKVREMDFHLTIVRPDIAVITGISAVHSDAAHMGSLANVITEKQKLIEHLRQDGTAILNYSDPAVRAMAPHTRGSILWYGARTDYAPSINAPYVSYSDVHVTTAGTDFMLHDHTTDTSLHLSTRLIGTFHASTITAIYVILKKLNPYFVNNFDQGVRELLEPLRGRMNIEPGPHETLILNDALRANPISTIAGLTTFESIPYAEGRKVAILADMGELEHPEEEHTRVGQHIATLKIDVVICAGRMQRYTADAIRGSRPTASVHWYPTVADAKKDIEKLVEPHDFIYLKGSLYSRVGAIFSE